jgi:hypothetical protein
LPACCCQRTVAGGFIYADLSGETSTPLALHSSFTVSSPVCETLLQAFPFPSTLGKVTLHPLSQAGMFIYSSCGKWAFSPLLWSFPPTATFTSFPTLDCWVCAGAPAFSGPACLFTAHMGSGSSPLFCGVCLPQPLFFLFYFILFYYSYVHTKLGSFLPPACTPSLTTHSAPSLSPPPPQYPAETILPLFLILL